MFFADLTDNKNWYLVKKPENGVRSTMDSSTEVYCLVRTTKIHDVSDFVVQQSDFVRRWDGEKPPQSTSKINSMKGFVKSHPNLLPLASSIYYRLQNITNPENLSGRNRHLTKHRVEEWLESS